MKHIPMLARDIPQEDKQKILYVTNKFDQSTSIQDALSEHEILAIQDQFLTNGFHYVQMPDMGSGRVLIETFLASLDCYHNVACLTLERERLPQTVTNLYQEIYMHALGSISSTHIEEYLVDHFYFDFLWIELSDVLCKQVWFEPLKQKLQDLGIAHALPIVQVSYNTVSSQFWYV
jgi:hypothetical protein